MPDPVIDPAIARLTENEKQCLRRRLLPQTAKEMAIDLGISPHAVEKRLKMARAKLGQSSSLAAARLLAVAEGYQPLVPGSSDLSVAGDPGEGAAVAPSAVERTTRPFLHKGLIMLAALFLVALVQDVSMPAVEAPPPKNEKGEDVPVRKVGMEEAIAFLRPDFHRKDTDHSGTLDAREASAMEPRDRYRDASLPPAPSVGGDDTAAERKWMAKLDNDHDGKVSEQEYVEYMLPWTLWTGVPAAWQPAADPPKG